MIFPVPSGRNGLIFLILQTMSFLAYVLRVYAHLLQDFLPKLPEIVVRLLKDCPRERSSARKVGQIVGRSQLLHFVGLVTDLSQELLVATRHIINFNFRKIFLNKIDELLDERVLIGDGLTVYETMRYVRVHLGNIDRKLMFYRPLAYSMLADLIHHVRDSLDRNQIGRTVEVYTKNLHDNFPGTSFQTMSAKLLLNLAEFIAKLEDKQEGGHGIFALLKLWLMSSNS